NDETMLHHRFLPQLLFYLTVFSIPYYQWRQISPALPILKVDWLLVMALIAIIVPALIIQKSMPSVLKSNLWPWLGLFLLINFISSLFSPFAQHALTNLINPLLIAYVFIALNMIMISRKGFAKYLPLVLSWAIGINAFLGILGYFFGFTLFGGERGRGLTIGANNMALMSIFTVPILVHWLLHAKTRVRALVAGILLLVTVLGVVSSESRGGFLGLSIIIVLLLFELRHRFHPKYLGIVIAFAGGIMILLISFIPEDYIQRQTTIGNIGDRGADRALRRREAYLRVAWDAFKDRPLIGSGTSAFSKIWVGSEETRRFEVEERPAHNTYAEVLVGTGGIGLVVFLLILWKAFANFRQAGRMFNQAGERSMASLTSAYQLSFIAVCIYFLFKSGIDHKLFLLSLPLSQIALSLAREDLSKKDTGKDTEQ
ncbi:MAG: O-antigen ligase family protein, partial [Verrucomicrobiota bacterium]